MVPAFPLPDRLRRLAEAPVLPLFRTLGSTPKGLTETEATARVERIGPNVLPSPPEVNRLRDAVGSPFVALLSVLCLTFVIVGDVRAALTVAVMVVLSVILRHWQSTRSDRAVRALRGQVTTTATVRRRAADGHEAFDREVPVEDLVPGDIVVLTAGDIVPADVRLLTAVDLSVDQSALTGETLPVTPTTLCFAGTSVVGGSATSVVVATGADTCFGAAGQGERPESSFDVGVRAVGWTLVRFMLVMVPIVLVVNGTITGDWAQAAMFALAVAVGLTPEMLPVIVTTNLARGAVRLARHRVIVKRLNAVQDLGGMDVLCVDKTGTLTEDRVAYAHSVDPLGRPDGEAAEHAYLAVHFQVTPLNSLDEAIAEQLADESEDLLYDCAQLALPWDRVDRAYLRRPRRWDARDLARFMLVFGPVSSLFDLAMFGALWWALDLGERPELFQTGWFVESLLSQVLVVLVLRGRGRASWPALGAAVAVGAIALALPLTGWLGLHALPAGYFLWLAGILAAYTVTVHLFKALFLRAK